MGSIIFMVINFKIVKSTLQNALFLHFFSKKFAYVKKKQYLCIVIQKGVTRTQKNNTKNSQLWKQILLKQTN